MPEREWVLLNPGLANTSPAVRRALPTPDLCHREPEFFEGARSNILTTFRLRPGLTYDPLHDAMKRRGYVIYAGPGDFRTYAFRVANMGTPTPPDMEAVVLAFGDALADLGVAR